MATDDLFGSDSDSGNDTDDLIASAQQKQDLQPKSAGKKRLGAAAKKSARLQKSAPPKKKKNVIPDADNLFDDSDDSDDSEEEEGPSKKDRMEALIRARRENSGPSSATKSTSAAKLKVNKKDSTSGTAEIGYDSETSIRSADYVRTKEDDDFIDADDDDPDARRELYAEQHFDDEEAEEVDDYGGKGKRKRKYYDDDVDLRRSKKNEEDADNPIMIAVSKMKKNKKVAKKTSDLEEEAKEFVFQMVVAANEDEEDLKAKRPAMRKLAMLPSVVEISGRRDMMRPLLDNQFLTACGQWIQPLPNGMLGTVTLRSELLRSVSKMTGETGVSTDDLKRSGFGKKVMALYMHPNETPEMKRFLKQLIEQWSRPVFQKNGNMKDLENVQRERQVSSIARTNALKMTAATSSERATMNDFSTIIAKGQVRARELGNNRVRVPFSKGFEFSVRPEAKAPTDESKKLHSAKAVAESREALNKRLLENKRVKKNYRSANISIEGRATK